MPAVYSDLLVAFFPGMESKEECEVAPFWVPARIEVLGKHTDYVGGKSLVAALSKGFAFMGHATKNDQILVLDAESRQEIRVDLKDGKVSSNYPWKVYVKTVFERVLSNFGPLNHGAVIGLASNVPTAAGMSSSSALISGLFLALREIYSLDQTTAYKENIHSAIDLSDYLGHVENGQTYKSLSGKKGVGTFGGSQDHAAILCSKAGVLQLFSFLPTQFIDEVALPDGYCFVIASSGVRAEKTRNALKLYNQCAMLAQQILESEDINPNGNYTSLRGIVEQDGFDINKACSRLQVRSNGKSLSDRLFQFREETQRIYTGGNECLQK